MHSPESIYSLLADLVMIFHLGFIVFAVFGAFLVLRWRWIIFLHLPTVAWAAAIEITGGICPLTPLENSLRLQSLGETYSDSFVQHYIGGIIYPTDLTTAMQTGLGLFVLAINALAYWWIYRKKSDSR